MLELTDSNFKEQIKEGKVLVDCFATWCGVCKMLKPKLEALNTDYKILFLDVDKCPKSAKELGVNNLPAIIIYKDGKEVKRGSFDILMEIEKK